MADQIIDGEQYEKELLDLTRQHTTGINEQNLSKDEVAELFASAANGRGVTDTEEKTLAYIRRTFRFTEAAVSDVDQRFAKLCGGVLGGRVSSLGLKQPSGRGAAW